MNINAFRTRDCKMVQFYEPPFGKDKIRKLVFITCLYQMGVDLRTYIRKKKKRKKDHMFKRDWPT